LFNGKIMQCPGNSNECTSKVKNGYYLNSENNELITCSNGSCTSAKT